MVTTFAEYLLVAREGSFEMRPVSHNLISLCCSLSLSPYQATGLGKVWKKFPLVLSIWEDGAACEVGVAGAVCGMVFRAQGRKGGSRHLVRAGVGKAEGAGGRDLCRAHSSARDSFSWMRSLPHVPRAYGLISHQDKVFGNFILPSNKSSSQF